MDILLYTASVNWPTVPCNGTGLVGTFQSNETDSRILQAIMKIKQRLIVSQSNCRDQIEIQCSGLGGGGGGGVVFKWSQGNALGGGELKITKRTFSF